MRSSKPAAFLSLPTLFLIMVASPVTNAADYSLDESWPAPLPESIQWGQVPNVTLDDQGHIYAFHRETPPVLKFNHAGALIDSWGEHWITRPHGFRFGPHGYLWATDYDPRNGHTVTKFDTDGRVHLRLGARGFRGKGPNTFNGPTDVAVAENGDIFVADGHWNNRIVKYSAEGRYLLEWGSKGAQEGEFDLPHSIVIDRRGRVLVADRGNSRIQLFDQEGSYLDQWSQFGRPSGLFIDNDDVLYVADYQVKHGITYGSADDGKILGFIGGTDPEGVSVDSAGNVYAAEVLGGAESEGKIVKRFNK